MVRFLISCPDCRRQFDATGRPVGAEFRCSCGTALKVTKPAAHDAAVIRCSSCGAPREGQAQVCRYCSSEFTLHERDLTTICPGCMARVSSRARFCHSCSSPLMKDGAAAPETEFRCPSCPREKGPEEKSLVSRRLGKANVAVYDCTACGGLWIEKEVFEVLADRARAGKLTELAAGGVVSSAKPEAVAEAAPASGSAGDRAYRPCVICGALMNRRNYGRKSGVIVDVCAKHGLWFDLHELDRLLRWMREGGEERTQALQGEEERTVERQKRLDKEVGDQAWADRGGPTVWPSASDRGSFLGDLLTGGLAKAMFRLFE
jgi:Zn-finger nucleic acid-binding protein